MEKNELKELRINKPKDDEVMVLEVINDDNVTYVNPAFDSEAATNDAERSRVNGKTHATKKSESSTAGESVDIDENFVSRQLSSFEQCLQDFYSKHRRCILGVTGTVAFLLYNVYLGYAISLNWHRDESWCEGVGFLLLISGFAYFLVFYYVIVKRFLVQPLERHFLKLTTSSAVTNPWFERIVWMVVLVLVLTFLIIDSSDNRERLISAGGLVILVAIGYIFSANPRKVVWRPVFSGMLLQFVLGLIVLRWDVGKAFFECFGNKTKLFLDFTDHGSKFVFGYLVTGELKDLPPQEPVFAFKVLSTIIFFSFVISILYYYGIMQVIVVKVGWFLQSTMGTTACESMNAAGNIFLGMTEAPLMIKPFLSVLTKSELHAVMTGGFATIAGAVLAAYINFGVKPSHLLSASVMSAPAALGFSKLFYPETEESKTRAENIVLQKGEERNAIEAAANGAASAVALVSNITANLIAFLASIHFLNSALSWFGGLVGWDFLSFEWLVSQTFRPLAFVMGVQWAECEMVGKLIGLKTVINEFVAYKELSGMLREHKLSARAEAISVFALCGFSNIGSIGIMLGALTTLAPDRKRDLAALSVRAMIAGSIACFMTACVAGTLLEETSRAI